MIAYTGYKVSILEGKKSVDILQAVNKDHFDENYTFGAKQGMNIAVAVLNTMDYNSYIPIDPRYGRIVFTKYSYGTNE